MTQSGIKRGDVVVATRDGGHDRAGLPQERPIAGRAYRVLGTYDARYGLGCRLEGLDPHPYMGYFLFVAGKGRNSGWYFTKMEKADDEFTDFMQLIRERQAGDKAVPERDASVHHSPGRRKGRKP